MPVETVDDEELWLLDSTLFQGCGNSLRQALLGHTRGWRRKDTGHLVHDDDVPVFVQDVESEPVARCGLRVVAPARIEANLDDVPFRAALAMGFGGTAVDRDAALVDHSLGDRVGDTQPVVQNTGYRFSGVAPGDLDITSFHP